MRNEPWVWLEVRDAGTSGAGAVPLRSAQMMGQQKKKKKKLCMVLMWMVILILTEGFGRNTVCFCFVY